MDSLSQNPLNLALDEFAHVDTVALADFNEGFMPFGVELGSNIFAVEGHLSGHAAAVSEPLMSSSKLSPVTFEITMRLSTDGSIRPPIQSETVGWLTPIDLAKSACVISESAR